MQAGTRLVVQFSAWLSGDHHKTDDLILLSSTKQEGETTNSLNVHVTKWRTAWFGFVSVVLTTVYITAEFNLRINLAARRDSTLSAETNLL